MADPQHRQIDRSGPTKPIEDLCAPLQMIEGKSRFLEQKVPPLPQAGAGAGHRIAASCKRRSRAQFRCCTANTKPNPKAEAPSVTQAGTGAVYASLLRGKVERYERAGVGDISVSQAPPPPPQANAAAGRAGGPLAALGGADLQSELSSAQTKLAFQEQEVETNRSPWEQRLE